MKKGKIYTFGIVACALFILLMQVVLVQQFPDHVGTDDQSVGIIEQIAPDYQPWASSLWEPADDTAEQTIFALQAVLGLGIIVFYVLKQRKKHAIE